MLARIDEQASYEGLSLDELANLVRFHAFGMYAAEGRLAGIATRGRGRFNPLARLRGDRRRAREIEEVVAVYQGLLQGFGGAFAALLERCQAEELPVEEFGLRFADLASYAWLDFRADADANTPATVREVLMRHVQGRLARLGADLPVSWEPQDEAFSLAFNGLVFEAVPATALRWVYWPLGSDDLLGGPDSPDGTLVVALVPTVWRHWFDLALAPGAFVFVYEQADPSAGLDLAPDETAAGAAGAQLDRLCPGYAAAMRDRYCGPVDVRVTTVGGRPAVRATAWLKRGPDGPDGAAFDPETESDPELLKDAQVMEHVWVHLGTRIWHLQAWAPAWWAPQYLRTMREVIDSFECAA